MGSRLGRMVSKVSHFYDLPWVYQILYGNRYFDTAMEAYSLAHILNANAKLLPLKNLDVLELFAGHVSLEERLRPLLPGGAIKKYATTDGYVGEGPVDVYAKGTKMRDFHLVLAPFFSINATMPYDGPLTYGILADFFYRIARNARALYIHFEPYPSVAYLSSICNCERWSQKAPPVLSVPSPIIPLENDGEWSLSYVLDTKWDRSHAAIVSHYPKGVDVMHGKEVVERIQVKVPTVRTYWSESELFRALSDAGFNHIVFANGSQQPLDGNESDFDVSVLPTEYQDEDSDFRPANSILAIRK